MRDEGGRANRQSSIVNRQWRQRPSLICVPSYRCVGKRLLGRIVPKEMVVRNGPWAAYQGRIITAWQTRRRGGETGVALMNDTLLQLGLVNACWPFE
jgi:hypothetical protein